MTTFQFVPMTAVYARAILAWQYEPPYDFYNSDPETASADVDAVFLNPAYHYHAVLDSQGELVAYWCFGEDARVAGGDYGDDALDMGGGLRPDRTGCGLGPQLLQAAMAFARARFAPSAFRVTIAAWNERAQRACGKAGYRPVSTFNNPAGVLFVILLRATPWSFGEF